MHLNRKRPTNIEIDKPIRQGTGLGHRWFTGKAPDFQFAFGVRPDTNVSFGILERRSEFGEALRTEVHCIFENVGMLSLIGCDKPQRKSYGPAFLLLQAGPEAGLT